MEKILIEHDQGDVAIIGDFTFSIKELKEGLYSIRTTSTENGELFSIDILHESYNQERDEHHVGSDKFTGLFKINKLRNILAPKEFKFPLNKMIVPFVLNDGNDNIGLNIVAFAPPVRGRKKYKYE